ncbi:MAG: glycerate kinase [Clostridia bacterium]|nr:glycerate kinase [Clostridia bacterium]
MKILVACDSFKGSFSSAKAGDIIRSGLIEGGIREVEVCPVSDGGDGFGSVTARVEGAEKRTAKVKDAFFGETEAEYHIINGDAYIESARACGLRFGKDVMRATTYGVGQLIYSAAVNGAKNIYVGLGGSGTNDGGCGMACALGVKFYSDYSFIPTGRNLREIKRIDTASLFPIIKNANVFACTDVDAPFYGKNGAALTFSRQNGATAEEALRLDDGMKHLASLLSVDVNSLPGSGAAGGLGGGIAAFLGGKIVFGFDVIEQLVGLEEKVAKADIVITGEGRTDSQTARGKLPARVAELCKAHRKPCYIISGSVKGDVSYLADMGVSGIFASYAESPAQIDKTDAEKRLRAVACKAAESIKGSMYFSDDH